MTDNNVPQTTVVVAGRLSYCDAFKPREFEKGAGNAKYKTNILVPKEAVEIGGVTMGGKAQLDKIRAAIAAAKAEKWGNDKESQPRLGQSVVCMKDGDAVDSEGVPEKWVSEETAGHYVITASDSDAPTVVDRRKRVISEADGLVFSGSYARVVINTWGQDNKYGKRVNANLRSIQHIAKGEAFGKGGGDGTDLFGSLDDDDDTGFDGEVDTDDGTDMF